MIKKICIPIVCVMMIVLLSSCHISSFDTDTLLTPPQMNEVNSEIQDSIQRTIGGNYELRYPKSGNYQTAITSVDLTGDGVSESMCFYTSGNDRKVSFIILEKISDKWTAIGIAESQATDIDRVAFADLDGDSIMEIVVGWQYTSGEERAIEIFKFGTDTEMESVHTGMYNNFVVFNDSVVVISRNTTGKTASATLIGKKGRSISILNTVSLNTYITGFISVQSETANNIKSVYIDEQLESLMYATEVLTINENGEFTVTSSTLSDQTMRTRAYICTDIDDDGSLDIPVERALPEYKRGDITENLVYVDWYSYSGGLIEYITSAYTSTNESFFIELPEEWIDNITIQRDEKADRSTHFYMIDGENYIPMFSVRVFSQQEFTDNVKSTGWFEIATVNENVYTFRADSSNLPDKFTVDTEKITEIFHLIS